jgi:hypothetical protein
MHSHVWEYWLGLSLTLLGLICTALGVFLTRTRQTKRLGFVGGIRKMASRFASRFRKTSSVTVNAEAAIGVGIGVSAKGKAIPANGTDAQKIDYLIQEVQELTNSQGQTNAALRAETDERTQADQIEQAARISEDAMLRGRIEGLAGDLLWISAIGVALLFVGQILLAFWA